MPLQIFRDDEQVNNNNQLASGQLARLVYAKGIGLKAQYRSDVGMYGFAVAHNTGETTALGTSGAGPCQIIVVHKAAGHGALGHYPAHPDPDKIAQGVQQMILALGGGPVAAVVLAAGLVGQTPKNQLHYEIGVVARVRNMCPGAQVLWPTAPADNVWGACYYLPLQEEVGLFEASPGGFTGGGSSQHGITVHDYA